MFDPLNRTSKRSAVSGCTRDGLNICGVRRRRGWFIICGSQEWGPYTAIDAWPIKEARSRDRVVSIEVCRGRKQYILCLGGAEPRELGPYDEVAERGNSYVFVAKVRRGKLWFVLWEEEMFGPFDPVAPPYGDETCAPCDKVPYFHLMCLQGKPAYHVYRDGRWFFVWGKTWYGPYKEYHWHGITKDWWDGGPQFVAADEQGKRFIRMGEEQFELPPCSYVRDWYSSLGDLPLCVISLPVKTCLMWGKEISPPYDNVCDVQTSDNIVDATFQRCSRIIKVTYLARDGRALYRVVHEKGKIAVREQLR